MTTDRPNNRPAPSTMPYSTTERALLDPLPADGRWVATVRAVEAERDALQAALAAAEQRAATLAAFTDALLRHHLRRVDHACDWGADWQGVQAGAPWPPRSEELDDG